MAAQNDAVAAEPCLTSRPPRRSLRLLARRRRSAARSGSSASCATTRRASGRTCSSRSALRSSRSSPRTPGRTGRSRTRSGVVFDPTRIAAQIVTGIGFLGAGAIICAGLSVRGLTTAATPLGRGRDRDGRRRRLLRGRRRRRAVLVLISLGPLQLDRRPAPARGVRPEEAELAIELVAERRGRRRRARRDRGARRPGQPGRVRRRADGRRRPPRLDVELPSRRASPRRSTQARRRRARAVARR